MTSNTNIYLTVNLIITLLTIQTNGLSLDRTCKDGGVLTVMFWCHLPYMIPPTSAAEGDVSGLFPELLKKMVNSCCQAKVRLSYRVVKGPADFYTAIEDLRLNRSCSRFDLAMPLHTTAYGKTSFGPLPFITVTQSLGTAVLKHSNVSSAKLMSSLVQAWPVLMFIIITAAIAGIVMWLAEKDGNSRQFSRSFSHGAFDGFWWAFISMTSVGYGDKYPKSIIGRILGSSWIVLGMLFVTMFIGTLTTTLMTLLMEGTYNIQNEKISVVNGSEAHWLATSQRANIKVVTKQEELYQPLINYEVDAALVDINSLKGVVDNLQRKHNIRVSGILLKETFYGIVLRQNSTSLATCFRSFMEKHEDSVFKKLAKYSGTQKNELDPAEDYFGSGGIFSISVYIMIVLFLTLSITGVLWEVYKCRKMNYRKECEIEDQEFNRQIRDRHWNGQVTLATTSTASEDVGQSDSRDNIELGPLVLRSKQSEV